MGENHRDIFSSHTAWNILQKLPSANPHMREFVHSSHHNPFFLSFVQVLRSCPGAVPHPHRYCRISRYKRYFNAAQSWTKCRPSGSLQSITLYSAVYYHIYYNRRPSKGCTRLETIWMVSIGHLGTFFHRFLPSFPVSLSIAAHLAGRNPCATRLSEGDSHLPTRRPGPSSCLFKTLKREREIFLAELSLLPVTHRCAGSSDNIPLGWEHLAVMGSHYGIARVRFFARIVPSTPSPSPRRGLVTCFARFFLSHFDSDSFLAVRCVGGDAHHNSFHDEFTISTPPGWYSG